MSDADSDRHLPSAVPIDAYGNGGFRFADMSHRGSLLCLPDSMRAWPVERADQIDEQALALVFSNADRIDTLIIGTGREVILFPNPLRDKLRALGIVVDAMQTGPAIRVYNIMIGEGRRVAAGLIAVS
ncbi:membrane protein [Afipia sp. P52-10]|uniref:Mth938-like domain-containing protein n=1 Tax=Afipia sp. P52-10 TaxID=1429916 RepID=UPI0003DF1E41|nr:MTH938/NDUFAF3 family protein [Afipia sp. P52-10]ETR75238.1 membrane protein [Afipia sp. P52-10]